MARTLAFPVPSGTIEALDFMLGERRRTDPTTPSRDDFLRSLVEDAVAAGMLRLCEQARKRVTLP
ncbi:hypothetical protein [Methylobacterium pseudosasicola]|uniref:Uncharacterized protein n=1 Tax=Methylobacterium pseudosasicola TaxID=582667 RepID=A0A1I4VJG7_9HYPH|nr:hypothetical protein [Methylobacterium pseudosasicola]SFN01265.1 hypothetical protein SAMN05192568_11045 [Methylobacterium pseudosasicola]